MSINELQKYLIDYIEKNKKLKIEYIDSIIAIEELLREIKEEYNNLEVE